MFEIVFPNCNEIILKYGALMQRRKDIQLLFIALQAPLKYLHTKTQGLKDFIFYRQDKQFIPFLTTKINLEFEVSRTLTFS